MTVLIECGEDAGALAASLATLVPGAVDGLVREVVVLDRGLDAGTRKVADHAGCRIAEGEQLAQVVFAAKGEWLLLIEPGARLAPGWIEGVAAHLGDVLAGALPKAARFSVSPHDRRGLMSRFLRRRSVLADGLLLPKAGLAPRASQELEDLAKGVAARRLEATIRPRPRT
ncbi:glycosyltransferase family protein [Aureimonas psammosilenae]|uniref:glycosyl transferase family 2 n=1 Tax=Aureimonas psammosilenae TaxID=2495496 RepID=UPI001AEEB5DE|nr:glycosyl transferase family 2 [Aureimonas psammosilenae]